MSSVRPNIYVFDGNIAAGKTTLALLVSEHLGGTVYLEPTTENPYLSLFYADPKRYGFKMQMWMLLKRFKTYLDALAISADQTKCPVLLDRSIFSDCVFAENSYNDGLMTEKEYDIYVRVSQQMIKLLPRPRLWVYLDVEPSECLRRIRDVRQRECEKDIPLEYLEKLRNCYDRFVATSTDGRHLTLDWNDFGETAAVADQILSFRPDVDDEDAEDARIIPGQATFEVFSEMVSAYDILPVV
jgi:deoxyadenosine/deoxycytidine kinase